MFLLFVWFPCVKLSLSPCLDPPTVFASTDYDGTMSGRPALHYQLETRINGKKSSPKAEGLKGRKKSLQLIIPNYA
jgi:hypothetical protein